MTVSKNKKKLQEQEADMPIFPDNHTAGVMQDARKVIDKKKPVEDGEAKALIDLSQAEGWILLRKHIDFLNKELFELTRKAARANGNDMQTAGLAFSIYDVVLEHSEKLVNFVESPLKRAAFERDEENRDDADDID